MFNFVTVQCTNIEPLNKLKLLTFYISMPVLHDVMCNVDIFHDLSDDVMTILSQCATPMSVVANTPTWITPMSSSGWSSCQWLEVSTTFLTWLPSLLVNLTTMSRDRWMPSWFGPESRGRRLLNTIQNFTTQKSPNSLVSCSNILYNVFSGILQSQANCLIVRKLFTDRS